MPQTETHYRVIDRNTVEVTIGTDTYRMDRASLIQSIQTFEENAEAYPFVPTYTRLAALYRAALEEMDAIK